MAVLAVGLALTALAISLFNFYPQLLVEKITIAAHTKDDYGDRGLPHYLASNVPDPATKHELDLECEQGYNPIAAWHEVIASHPALDVMYTINAYVEGDRVGVALRARKKQKGYVYIDVFVLCSRL